MASAPVVLRGGVPTGLTLSVDLRAIGDDDSGSPTNVSLTENTNNKSVYRGTTTAALAGWFNATVKDGSGNVYYNGYVFMADDTKDHLIMDSYIPTTGLLMEFIVDNTGFTPTTTEVETSSIVEATADHFNGRTIIWLTGVLLGQATRITDYALSGGRGHFTYQTLTEAPGNGDKGIIV